MDSLVNNIDLFMILKDSLGSLSDSNGLYNFLKLTLNFDEERIVLKTFCQKFCSSVSSKWKQSGRNLAQFIRNNENWLEIPINWPEGTIAKVVNAEQEEHAVNNIVNFDEPQLSTQEASTSSSTFTPRKPFEELCLKQKRRRLEQINKSLSPEELNAATVKSLKSGENEDVGKIMEHLLGHPEDVEKVKRCLSKNQMKPQYSPDKALAIAVSLNLSRWKYISLRESASEEGSDLYPSYYKLKQAKTNCYPDKEDILVTEDGASIKLQGLLNLTVSRLLDVVEFDLNSKTDLQLISKWGFDGASSQSNYKQQSNMEFDDSSVFMASLVPIRLQKSDGTVVWENDRPSSTFYCRPIMFQFVKETQSTVAVIRSRIENEIEALQPSKIQQVEVKHQLLMTMIDGKIASYLSETSASVCDICKAKPSQMNDLTSINDRQKNEDMYQYGLSSLHAWIRCMECLLHIAYRMEFKAWSCRGENKEKMKISKQNIQQAFQKECGLLIDMVKQGAGTTNDGNTARRFFEDADRTSRITGIDKTLIEKFHVILQTIASGYSVDLSKFSQYCRDTAKLYVELYPWYYMPSSVHKLLIHGADIIQHFGSIPIGKLSEEAAESRNKHFRNYREDNSRKVSRVACNEDILHNLLVTSDPKITSLRPRMAKQRTQVLSPEARELLMHLPPDPTSEFINVDDLHDNESDSD